MLQSEDQETLSSLVMLIFLPCIVPCLIYLIHDVVGKMSAIAVTPTDSIKYVRRCCCYALHLCLFIQPDLSVCPCLSSPPYLFSIFVPSFLFFQALLCLGNLLNFFLLPISSSQIRDVHCLAWFSSQSSKSKAALSKFPQWNATFARILLKK